MNPQSAEMSPRIMKIMEFPEVGSDANFTQHQNVCAHVPFTEDESGVVMIELLPFPVAEPLPLRHFPQATFVAVAFTAFPLESTTSPSMRKRKLVADVPALNACPSLADALFGSEVTVNVPEDVNVCMVFPPLVVTVPPVAVSVPVTYAIMAIPLPPSPHLEAEPAPPPPPPVFAVPFEPAHPLEPFPPPPFPPVPHVHPPAAVPPPPHPA